MIQRRRSNRCGPPSSPAAFAPDNLFTDILQPEDVSAAFTWLSSEDARFATGVALPVAAGATTL